MYGRLSLPYLVVQGKGNPVNNPAMHKTSAWEKEKEKKKIIRKEKREVAWEKKGKKIFCSSSNSPFPSHFLLKLIFLFHFFLKSGFFFSSTFSLNPDICFRLNFPF
jgi:hypothetical protein